jgi:purine-binding chemotaxis protein CheW
MTQDPFLLAEIIRRKEQELYDLRALLARKQAPSSLPAGEFVVLRCRLQAVAIAIPAVQIREVVQMASLAPVPDAPPWLAGVLLLGPEYVPVIDLSARQSGASRARDPSEFIVLAQTRAGTRGLVVDTIDGLVTVDGRAVARPGPEIPFGPHVVGIATLAGESVIVVSAAALSSADYSVEAAG